jgi:hypothetical protein
MLAQFVFPVSQMVATHRRFPIVIPLLPVLRPNSLHPRCWDLDLGLPWTQALRVDGTVP